MMVELLHGEFVSDLVTGAFAIAWHYLDASGQLGDSDKSRSILTEKIVQLIIQGERNRLKLANKAITAFELERQVSLALRT